MIISLGGVPGSGKTSVGQMLSQRLGYAFYSMGGLRAKMALERGLSIDELNTQGETDKTTDTAVDDYQRELGKTADRFIVEGRLSWHFIPDSFKIFLTCDPDEAARRIFQARTTTNERGDEPAYRDISEAHDNIVKRTASDRRRYQTHYGIDYQDPNHYDLVIDTTPNPDAASTAWQIIDELKKRGLLSPA